MKCFSYQLLRNKLSHNLLHWNNNCQPSAGGSVSHGMGSFIWLHLSRNLECQRWLHSCLVPQLRWLEWLGTTRFSSTWSCWIVVFLVHASLYDIWFLLRPSARTGTGFLPDWILFKSQGQPRFKEWEIWQRHGMCIQRVGAILVTIFGGNPPYQEYHESALRSQMKDQTLLPGCLWGFPCQAVGRRWVHGRNMAGGGVSREEVTFELWVLLVGKKWKRCSLGEITWAKDREPGKCTANGGRCHVATVSLYIFGVRMDRVGVERNARRSAYIQACCERLSGCHCVWTSLYWEYELRVFKRWNRKRWAGERGDWVEGEKLGWCWDSSSEIQGDLHHDGMGRNLCGSR